MSTSARTVTIATRASDLALWQAHHVRDQLLAVRPAARVEILKIKTRGDKILDVALSKVGGKALFVKEIEQAILDGAAHIAVHSMKDVPAELAPQCDLVAVSERGNAFDALCTVDGRGLDDLPQGARVGTSSLRRQSQLLAARPDLRIGLLRGNVPTRLGKLDAGEFDAIVLAAAGLERLGLADRISQLLDQVLVPAVGQGVLGIETRTDDDDLVAWVRQACHDAREERRVAAERRFLARLGGSCQTPIAGYATYRGETLVLDGVVAQPDASEVLRCQKQGSPADAEAIGEAAADELLDRGARAIIAACEAAANA